MARPRFAACAIWPWYSATAILSSASETTTLSRSAACPMRMLPTSVQQLLLLVRREAALGLRFDGAMVFFSWLTVTDSVFVRRTVAAGLSRACAPTSGTRHTT